MPDDYLFDRTGKPDPDLARIEAALAAARFDPARRPLRGRARPNLRRLPPWIPLALAASVASLVLGGGALFRAPKSGWETGGRPVRVGETLTAVGRAPTLLRMEAVGELKLEPGSRLQLARSGRAGHEMALVSGTMHALIWAPPRRFTVATGGGRAVDLGCAYTMTWSEGGTGTLRVESGWVAFERGGIECFVPAGALCRSDAARGPGTPCFEDAPPRFVTALHVFDGLDPAASARPGALEGILPLARPRDGLTLWHLFARVDASGRGLLHDRLAVLLAVPAGVRRDAVSMGERGAIDAWWEALGLGSSEFWRAWKGEAPAG